MRAAAVDGLGAALAGRHRRRILEAEEDGDAAEADGAKAHKHELDRVGQRKGAGLCAAKDDRGEEEADGAVELEEHPEGAVHAAEHRVDGLARQRRLAHGAAREVDALARPEQARAEADGRGGRQQRGPARQDVREDEEHVGHGADADRDAWPEHVDELRRHEAGAREDTVEHAQRRVGQRLVARQRADQALGRVEGCAAETPGGGERVSGRATGRRAHATKTTATATATTTTTTTTLGGGAHP